MFFRGHLLKKMKKFLSQSLNTACQFYIFRIDMGYMSRTPSYC